MKRANAARVPGLDVLRALAITLVFLFHYRRLPDPRLIEISRFGWVGVDLFFVLSGYLIAGQLLGPLAQGRELSWRGFFLRRIFRTLPSYLFVVGLYFLIPAFREMPLLPPLWKFLSFTQNIGLHFGAFSHAWSLCIEEQFYFVLPIAILLLARRATPAKLFTIAALVSVGGLALRAFLWNRHSGPDGLADSDEFWMTIYYPTWTRLDPLGTGVGLAMIRHFRPAWWARMTAHGNLFLALAALWITLAWFACREQRSFEATVYGFPLLALGFGCLTVAALSANGVLAKLRVPGAGLMATLAYSCYLVHKPILHLIRDRAEASGVDPRSAAVLGLTLAAVLAASALLYLVVEKPFLDLRRRWRVA